MEGQKSLLEITERFKQASICVVGDMILDEYVWGSVDRISPEAPVVVVKVNDESYRLGGAANVAHNIKSLGGNSTVVGVVGSDAAGRRLKSELEAVGVGTTGLIEDSGEQTSQKTRVIAHAQQVVRIDRESVAEKEDRSARVWPKLKEQLNASNGLIISDYAKGVVGKVLLDNLNQSFSSGELLKNPKPVLIDPKDVNFDLYSRATVVTPNRKEAEQASGVRILDKEDAMKAADVLREKWNTDTVLVTLGEMGMVLSHEDTHDHISTVAREVFDVSGAGDTVSAAYILSLAVGASPKQAALIANQAAGIVVREIGTAVVTLDQLQTEIKKG